MIQYNVRIDPFKMLTLTSLQGVRQVNEHGMVTFESAVPENLADEYISLGLGTTWVDIYATDIDGSEKLWFKGTITEIHTNSEDGFTTLTVTVKTGSYLMDTSLHTRSYQTPGMTYNTVLDSYTSSYPQGDFIMKKGDGEPINTLIMQYNETDWEFTKRLATHFNTVLLADCTADGTKYYFGFKPSSPVATIDTDTFETKKEAGDYEIKSRAGASLGPLDSIYFAYRTKEIYQLGDQITFNGKPLFVYRIDTELDRVDLFHTYRLKTFEGFNVPKEYNLQCIGTSFYSKITAVEKDIVQVSINSDENQSGCGSRWFAYSTPYSTPDGTGWYCMPEIGDDVRLYIPEEDEANSYIISSTHLTTGETASDERINPDFKSIMNKQNKEALFTPGTLIFTNNKGMSIEIRDDEGIHIISDKEIVIESDKAIKMASVDSSITVLSPELILLEQDDTITQLQKNIAFKGAQVHFE